MKTLVIASLLVVGACGSTQTKDPKKPESQLLGLEIRGETETEKYDLNGDGKPDVFKTYVWRGLKDEPDKRVKLLARQDLDLDFNDTIDVKRHFSENGQVVREEMDLDFDGNIDAIDYYDGKPDNNSLYRRDMALNFEGKASIVKFYTNQKLARKERDTDGDKKFDVFEFYENGKLVKVGVDRNGDEKPDVYTEVQDGESGS